MNVYNGTKVGNIIIIDFNSIQIKNFTNVYNRITVKNIVDNYDIRPNPSPTPISTTHTTWQTATTVGVPGEELQSH